MEIEQANAKDSMKKIPSACLPGVSSCPMA